ncbi:hypothetical protein BH11BAC2_BH11BAC2_19470 [soil metagenome]
MIAIFSLLSITSNAAVLSVTTAVVKPTCFGSCDGIINTTVKGGTPPYTYAWSNGQTTASLTGLCIGAYTVTVTDDKGAQVIKTANVSQPSQVRATLTATPLNCNGACDGSISTVPGGGTPPYTYLWSNGATSANISSLCAGVYSLTITDSKGCVGYCNKSVTQPTLLRGNSSSVNATCFGACNGSAASAPSGGVPPYDYSWSTGATTSSINGLCAGFYTITVTDFRKCTRTSTVEIKEAAALVLTPSSTNISCFGACNGTADVFVSGGTGVVTYLWSNGATTANLSNLCAGSFTVTVTDENNCQAQTSINIIEPKALSTLISKVDVTCFNASNGSALVVASEGTAPYTYLWSNGATTDAINNIAAGSYTVTVTDFNGCSKVESVTIIEPKALHVVVSGFIHASCLGSCNGSANVVANEGTAPYTYLWSNGATSDAIDNLCAGTYTVTVTDKNGCVANTSVTISQPSVLVASSCKSNVSCKGGCNGSALASANGGTSPYSYLWSNNAISASINALCAGWYSVTITDANGCTSSSSVEVKQPANDLSAVVIVVSNSTGANIANGSLSVTASGGTSPYSYLWSNGQTSNIATNLLAGTYTVTVTDANGCTTIAQGTITAPTLCGGFRTQTQGGWGQCQQNGNNPGSYLAQHFASSFPNGVTVGCGNKTILLTTYTAVCNFLPSGTTPRALTTSYINPAQTYRNVFAGQVVTLAINLGFDQTIPSFSSSQTLLGAQVIQSGPYIGWTVNQLFAAANAALGGCSTTYSISTLNTAVDNVNNNYDNGYSNNGFLACPGQGGCGGGGNGGCGGGGNGGCGGGGHRIANAGSDLENFGMIAYPNPFATTFYVQLHAETPVEIFVMDISGKVVAHFNNVTNGIEVGSDLPSGVYFLKATDESGASRTIKMVKGN